MSSPRADLLEAALADPRYAPEAYEFLCQALAYTQQVLNPTSKGAKRKSTRTQEGQSSIPHVTGQDLCDGIRRFAFEQFGIMTPVVFRCWGLRGTPDFGKMVYHLIESGLWHKSEGDSIDDFDDQFDFDRAFSADSIEWHIVQ